MTTIQMQLNTQLDRNQWVRLGAVTAVVSVMAVLIVQAVAIAIWPDIALFKPLDSYARAALFTAIPAIAATALLAWLARRQADPVPAFLKIAAVVLVLSIIPDYLLPVAYKTFLASTVTAFLHVVAAVVTVFVLVTGYRRQAGA
ncbi:MAG: hypothetical protein HND44_14785 [Chloroflexi bacterium]|nr:hypothetical protein [Ardenticatenaceae bacterium]MBL1129729.1 hypothetical protein [Chloroflexota bacterium]NOG35811.1 hypothetical protein [Chloroflexota bacterium]GIK57907.1 MAG: hypothetical protein BroJett015_35700 [Chloroflexota bacterium]